MSSDDSDFDKEAEREKLREKYERDQKDRENTQRMSELLLQGATMTGRHCGDCGDPIFRYDGQEFCPTCQREVGGNGAADGNGAAGGNDPADGNDGERTDSAIDPETAQADAEAATADGSEERSDAADSDGEPRVEINDVRVADRHADRSDLRDPPSRTGDRADGRPSGTRRSAPQDRATRDRAGHRESRARSSDSGRSPSAPDRDSSPADLGAARESLVRTLTDLTRRAEETDDVARTRDLLAATREAAEALAALDRADRDR